MTRVVYTDGACKGNPGPGGWAWVELERGAEVGRGAGSEAETTNNRMELVAVIEALRRFAGSSVHIHTDSSYVSNGVTKWLEGWKRRGWKTAEKKPVKNRELWEALDSALGGREVTFTWVRGHASSEGNNLADRYAREQARLAAQAAGQ